MASMRNIYHIPNIFSNINLLAMFSKPCYLRKHIEEVEDAV